MSLWILPKTITQARVLNQLQTGMDQKSHVRESINYIYLDSFDWRLAKKGWCLRARQKNSHCLLELSEITTGRQLATAPVELLPRMIGDFPEGNLRNYLCKYLPPRAVLPIFELHLDRIEVVSKDGEGKIRFRLYLDKPGVRRRSEQKGFNALPDWLWIEPVVGYEKYSQRFISGLTRKSSLITVDETPFSLCLKTLDINLAENFSRRQISMQSEDKTANVVASILLHQLDVMEHNEWGVINNIDSEFLHDFRIAVRRTRSALGQIKGIFEDSDLDIYKAEFAWLGALTTPARDLDVMLLEFKKYQSMLPGKQSDDLLPLKDYFVGEHKFDYEKLTTSLRSERYIELKRNWRDILQNPELNLAGKNANRPVSAVARERISHVYKRILKEGRRITPESPDTDYHELRKSGKKLRYLMEFFRELYDKKEIKVLIKELKLFQDNLGEFQDLCIHIEKLDDFLAQIKSEHEELVATQNAIQKLIEKMNKRKSEVLDEFHDRFVRFSSNKNQRRLSSLLGMENN